MDLCSSPPTAVADAVGPYSPPPGAARRAAPAGTGTVAAGRADAGQRRGSYAEVVFRRRATTDQAAKTEADTAASQPADEAAANAVPTGKGRPTPKRREAQRRRRTYIQAPKDRKEAARMQKERQKASAGTGQSREDARREQARALRSGDESKLGPRDAGPVRKLVRDVVDSRRGLGGYFLFATLGVLALQILLSVGTSQQLLTTAASAQVQTFLMYGWYALILLVAFDSFMLVRLMKRMVRDRYPDHTERGLSMYAVMRSLQIRRLRLPPPKVKPGEGVRD